MKPPKRALWLLNHTTLREFEVPILQSLGYEIYLPKIFPYDEGNLSASIDFSYDRTLTIGAADLAILNTHNFYIGISSVVREIINRHFDVAFFGFFPDQFAALARNFSGSLVMRPFGLANGVTYTNVTADSLGYFFLGELQKIHDRFWFGQAYENLAEIESGIFRKNAITLPLGLRDATVRTEWTGSDARILFVCPRIGSSPYFNHLYRQFKADFEGFPVVIGGAQPIHVPDPDVTGFLPRSDYDLMMRDTRVMYYHSREKRHLHYHPIEAVRLGMPLVFMSGGLLDQIGGIDLPGRCNTVKEARDKIRRILNGDHQLIDKIQRTQAQLLRTFTRDYCEPIWRKNFAEIERSLEQARLDGSASHRVFSRKKVAVFLPQAYRGGTLDMVKLIAKMLKYGAQADGRDLDVVFAHPDSTIYSPKDFADLRQLGIKTRSFYWKFVSKDELANIQKLTGYTVPLKGETYSVPMDDANTFLDCDFWLIASDRLDEPLAPLRPYCMFAHDYLQRYVPQSLGGYYENGFIQTARNGIAVLANTPHTIEDIVQYVGVQRQKAILVPHLAQLEHGNDPRSAYEKGDYFIWTTNAGEHKNQLLTLQALTRYYEVNGGSLDCHVTGVESSIFDPNNKEGETDSKAHIKAAREYILERPNLAARLIFHGDLPHAEYIKVLSGARFLLHNVLMDNGTLSAVEAAYNRTPVVSSDYPPMRYISERYRLNATFFNGEDTAELSDKLAWMENNWREQQDLLPALSYLEQFSWKALAPEFWQQISTIIG